MDSRQEDEFLSKISENQCTKLLPKHNKRKYKRFACCIKYEVGPSYERFDSNQFSEVTKTRAKPMTNIIVISNPLSGGGRAGRFLSALRSQLAEFQLNMDMLTVTNPKDLEEGCEKIKLHDYDCIVICGGDGTINMTTNALFKNPDNITKVKVAVMNAGSGNDFHRSINGITATQLPDRMQNPAFYGIDCAQLKWWSPVTQKEESLYFISSVGLGVSPNAVQTAERWFKIFKGARYNLAGLVEIVKNKHVVLDLYLDGKLCKKDFPFTILHIQNTQTCGGNMNMCPFAKVDDGLLDVIMLAYDGSRKTVVNLFNQVKAGGIHVYDPKSLYYHAKKIRIEMKEDLIFQADGEIHRAERYMEIECIPKALNILY